jgi:8-amino-7-oxononanoate synthase
VDLEYSWKNHLRQCAEAGLERRLCPLQHSDGTHGIDADGRRIFIACSNDYLGLRFHPAVIGAGIEALQSSGSGSSGARAVTGAHFFAAALESALSALKGTESSLLYGTGYMGNVGTISTIASDGDFIFSDRKNHASLIDGCRLSHAQTFTYPHRDWQTLENLLQKNFGKGHRFIVSDGVFSMDGTIAPLRDLLRLANEYDAHLLIDDAHGLGVLGENGHGILEHFSIAPQGRIIQLGTCSKALGSFGGFVCGTSSFTAYLRQRSRPFLCSTMLPPSTTAASAKALEILQREKHLVEKLKNLSHLTKAFFSKNSIAFPEESVAIFPILIGSEVRAQKIARCMYDRGILLREIRYPSVPLASARLRLTLCASYDEGEWLWMLSQLHLEMKKNGALPQ